MTQTDHHDTDNRLADGSLAGVAKSAFTHDTDEVFIEIERYDDGGLYVSSHGQPIPCKIIVRDYDYDPYSVDDMDTIVEEDEERHSHALVIYEKGTKLT